MMSTRQPNRLPRFGGQKDRFSFARNKSGFAGQGISISDPLIATGRKNGFSLLAMSDTGNANLDNPEGSFIGPKTFYESTKIGPITLIEGVKKPVVEIDTDAIK